MHASICKFARLMTGALALAAAATVPAGAATVPYFDNFNDDLTGPAAPTEPAPESGAFVETESALHGTWSVEGSAGQNTYRVVSSAAAGTTTATGVPVSSIDFTGAGLQGSSFTMTTEVKLNAFSAGFSGSTRIGFGALGSDSGFSSSYYLVDYALAAVTNTGANDTGVVGQLRILESGGSGGTAGPISSLTPTVNQTYRLTLVGEMVDGTADVDTDVDDLKLTFTVQNLTTAGSPVSVDFIDDTPLTGNFFGYRNSRSQTRTVAGGGNGAAATLNADFDNFSLVPEPGSCALLGCAALLGLRRRR
jgi:hypothetical protein